MEEWKEYKLGEIASMKYGKLVPKNILSEGSIPIYSGYRYVGYTDKSNCSKDTIIVVARGVGGTGDVKITKEDCFLTNLSIAVNLDKDICIPYYFYYKYLLNNLKYLDSGSAQSQITIDDLKRLIVKLPNIETQCRIVKKVRVIDDKIEVNRRINEQLEELAQALFKSWFVDFEPFKDGEFVDSELGMIPKGWKVGTLGDIAGVVMGSSPAGSSYNTEGNGSIFYQGRTDFGFRFPCVRMYTTEPKRFAESNSVLLSVRAPVGDVNIAFEKCCIGRGLASIKSNCNADSYTYYLMKSLKPILDNYNNEGTVFGCINKDALNNLSIVVPTIDIIKEFEQIVSSFDVEIRRRSEETHHLTTLRDTLLPKLMSGEIDVNEVEI